MTLNPGASTTVALQFMMHGSMGGMHDFRLHLPTNDPKTPDLQLTVLSNWVQ